MSSIFSSGRRQDSVNRAFRRLASEQDQYRRLDSQQESHFVCRSRCFYSVRRVDMLLDLCFILISCSGCSKTHLPSYIEKEKDLKASGIDEIVCVRYESSLGQSLQRGRRRKQHSIVSFSVNDPFVMSAWGNQFNTKGKIRMLADPSATFTKALELSLELPPLGESLGNNDSLIKQW